jgi:putative protease
MTELALPAGSLQSALQAFAGGADAVYLGLKEYSARKYAENFSFDELAQLKKRAVPLQKKIYVAINTLLDDQELDQTRQVLRRLTLFEPDGIIVQDLGLAHMMRKEFPSLPIHASTQLAVHTISGVRQLQKLGFSRIVLSRELTFSEIETIRLACPDVSLKVFIHGAMCYGFSGLCMASHVITGRSANRGACAQICRTWFSHEDRNGYFFSLADLALGDSVTALRDIGIDSLKVEGRMKSPAYVRFAAEYYRGILDGITDTEPLAEARKNLEAQFTRTATQGWTFSYGKENPSENRHTPSLVTDQFPGHRGFPVAQVLDTQNQSATIQLYQDMAIRDGLLHLKPNGTGLEEPTKFGVRYMNDLQGTNLYTAKRGMQVRISIPNSLSLQKGDTLYTISRHDLKLPIISVEREQAYRYPATFTFILSDTDLTIKISQLPQWIGAIEPQQYPITVQRAMRPQSLQKNLMSLFSSSGEGCITAGEIVLHITNELPESELFIPLSQLKEIRRTYYHYLDSVIQNCLKKDMPVPNITTPRGKELPLRSDICSPLEPHLPWIDISYILSQLKTGKALHELVPVIDNTAYIPLAPVTFHEAQVFADLELLINASTVPICVGLNNVSQFLWAHNHPDIPVFADVYVYLANRYTATLLLNELPNLVGAYRWIEREGQDTTLWPLLATKPMLKNQQFPLPLFISRACYRYDTLHLTCEGCPRRGKWTVYQQEKQYQVVVQDCMTYLLENPEEH